MQATRVRTFLRLRTASWSRLGVLCALAALTLTLAGDGVRAAANTGTDPFEILKLEVRPNVIVVMDSSGSMRQRITATGTDYNNPGPNNANAAVVGDDHDSKLWNAKDVIRRVVTNNQTKVSFMFGRYTFSSTSFGPETGPTFLYKVTCASADTACKTNAGAVLSSGFGAAGVDRSATSDTFNEANGDVTYYLESNVFYNGVVLNLMSDGSCGTSPCTTTTGAPAKANPAPLKVQMYRTNNQGNKVTTGSPATFYFQGVRWNVGNNGTSSCGGFHALVPLQSCTTNEQLSLFNPFLADEVPKDAATGDIVGYTPGTSQLSDLTSLAGGGIKASGSTPIANSLRDIKSTFDTTLWPNRPNTSQKTFVIFITDGDDTCNYQSNFDNNDNDGTPGWARAAFQAQRLYNAGAADPTQKVPTFVIVFGGGANVTDANQIAYGGSGMTAVPDANNNQYWDRAATAAEVAACSTCRPAFTAATASDLEAAIQAALDQGVATGEFSDQQSITESVYELGPQLASPVDPMDPDTRYNATIPVLLQSTFEMSSFAGHLKAFRNVSGASSQLWDAGDKLCARVTGYRAKTTVSPQECDLGGVAATGVDTPTNTMGSASWNFAALTGSTTPDTIGGSTARIRRRIYTTTQNGVNASYTPPNLTTSIASATWASQAPLWPPNDAIDPAKSGNDYPAGVVDGPLGITSLTAPQLAALGACQVTTNAGFTYNLTLNTHACSRTGGIQKEAREIILAFTAGAQVDLGTDSKPKRDSNGEILYKARKWILAESTLAAPGIVSVPLENPTSVHGNPEYKLYRDGVRSMTGIAVNAIGQGFGMRNPDRDGQSATRSNASIKPTMTVVYHGTNHMLHAFRAGPCPSGVAACGGETGGEELWAFVPYDQLGKLYVRLSRGQSRTNPVYVIASPVRFSDVFVPGSFNKSIGGVTVSGSGVWRVVMLVGRGAAGKHLTAIDVTGPGPFTQQSNKTASPIVVWNRGNPDTNDGLVKTGSNSYNNSTAAGVSDYNAYLKMGETWSVPAIGFVTAANNVTTRKPNGVEFVAWMGSGYSDVTTEGTTFYAIDALTGDVIASHSITARSGSPLPTQNAIVARAAAYSVRALSFYDVANAGNNAVFNPITEKVSAVYIPDLHGRVYRFMTDTPATAPTLFRDLSADGNQPVSNAVALIAFDSDSSGVKPHVFLESGNDKRVPLPTASPFFRMYGVRDDDTTATDVFAPIDFPLNYRGTVQPATAFNSTGKARVFFGGTKFNPTGANCVSSFDSVVYALQAGTGEAAYDLTAGGDDRYVQITNQRINAVQTSGGQLITDFGLGAQNAPPPPAPPIVGSGGTAAQSNVLMGSSLPGTIAYKRGSSACR